MKYISSMEMASITISSCIILALEKKLPENSTSHMSDRSTVDLIRDMVRSGSVMS